MAKNRPVPASVLARLHGKGSMSEILNIERERLRQQSEAEMQKQLGAEQVEAPRTYLPSVLPSNLPADSPPNQPSTLPTKLPLNTAGQAPPLANSPTYVPTSQPTNRPSIGAPSPPHRFTEGLSTRSRFVGEILPGLPRVTVHTSESITNPPRILPESLVGYYRLNVHPGLPFQSQRHLLDTLCRLTLVYGTAACQITLELLAAASGIRNVKTLRKWLNNLHERNLIRYTPVHGDPRGSVILLTPPPGAPDIHEP